MQGVTANYAERMQCGVCEDAILQGTSGKLWHVNLCYAKTWEVFTNGWESFVYGQFTQVGGILVFRHVGNVHFVVKTFGSFIFKTTPLVLS